MSTRAPLFTLTVCLCSAVAGFAESPGTRRPVRARPDADPAAVTGRILAEVDARSELMANLEYLCDRIGPRLTGSEKLREAGAWARAKFAGYGLQNAHLETWSIPHAWSRGAASGRVTAPTSQRLWLETAGWSRATKGPTRGPVVVAEGRGPADVAAYRGKLKGAWVLLDFYTPVIPEVRRMLTPASVPPAPDPRDFTAAPGYQAFRRAFDALMIEEGAAGVLCDSGKEYGLIPMYSGSDALYAGPDDSFAPTALPVGLLASESYGLVWRLRTHGPVELELDLPGTFSTGPVEVANTVAELTGTDRPEEVVILGAHLDTWDLATGATDDGTGCMAVVEAARALRAAGARPRRTIRFVLFAGEEQGRFGSKNYVAAHAAEMDRVSAVLIHDMGTGRVLTLSLQGRADLRTAMDGVVAPFQDALRLDELTHRPTSGSDHVTFRDLGIPALATKQDRTGYSLTHHSQADTFDKVNAAEINQGAKVLAAWAYNVAMLPDRLPRAPGALKAPSYAAASPRPPAPAAVPRPAATR